MRFSSRAEARSVPNGFSTITRAQPPSGGLFNPAASRCLQDRLELIGRDREIKEPIAAGAAFLLELLEPFARAACSPRHQRTRFDDKRPIARSCSRIRRAPSAGNVFARFPELRAKFVIALRSPRHADDRQVRRQFAIGRDVVERGDELAMSEITGRAEDHDGAGFRHGPGHNAFAQRIACACSAVLVIDRSPAQSRRLGRQREVPRHFAHFPAHALERARRRHDCSALR